MPYIPQSERDKLEQSLAELVGVLNQMKASNEGSHAGQLNYVLTRICLDTLPQPARYDDYADRISALEGAKLEFYRRQVAVFEDKKADTNGDVF